MKRFQFEVAALTFECHIPDGVDVQKFLFPYKPFIRDVLVDDPVFVATITDTVPDIKQLVLTESFENDLGNVCVYKDNNGFVFTYSYSEANEINYLFANSSFTDVRYNLMWGTAYTSLALTSMLRTVFAQRVLFYDGFSIHSSVIKYQGKGYLFLGKSGTGKSTHTRLWLKYINGSRLLNDDNPICRFINGKLLVFGSPWSGKTHCYVNDSAEVASFVRLEQAPENIFYVKKGLFAWLELFPSISVLKESQELYDLFVNILNLTVPSCVIGHLKCLPDKDAALICENNIRQLAQND